MPFAKKDFIEIEFTGKIKNSSIFDSNIQEDIKKAGLKLEAKPFVFCLGEGMFLKGVEDFLIGKENGRYEIELSPEKAFGKRETNLVQVIPIKIFHQQKTNPVPGSVFNFDGKIAKVLSVSGGRVIVDFNHPLAGKTVVYEVKVLKKVEDINEKTKALIEFFTRKDFKFNIEGKKLFIEADKQFGEFFNLFRDKFKDLLGLELEIKEIPKTSQ
ncbi:MAG: peptidylprolyl isomerase [Nanoarchaeota archaeon]|nr:peptidylprolyl isomerase [Nanoarchaeota archaeon]